jgi:hypothetical protein
MLTQAENVLVLDVSLRETSGSYNPLTMFVFDKRPAQSFSTRYILSIDTNDIQREWIHISKPSNVGGVDMQHFERYRTGNCPFNLDLTQSRIRNLLNDGILCRR